jgi:hypothetical protein
VREDKDRLVLVIEIPAQLQRAMTLAPFAKITKREAPRSELSTRLRR